MYIDVRTVLGENGSNEKFEKLIFNSTFTKDKLKAIYSNLDILSFYEIMTEINELENKGYNIRLLKEKKHYYLSLPFFLILMVCLAGIFTLNTNDRRKIYIILFIAIITCVVIFLFSKFFYQH